MDDESINPLGSPPVRRLTSPPLLSPRLVCLPLVALVPCAQPGWLSCRVDSHPHTRLPTHTHCSRYITSTSTFDNPQDHISTPPPATSF